MAARYTYYERRSRKKLSIRTPILIIREKVKYIDKVLYYTKRETQWNGKVELTTEGKSHTTWDDRIVYRRIVP